MFIVVTSATIVVNFGNFMEIILIITSVIINIAVYSFGLLAFKTKRTDFHRFQQFIAIALGLTAISAIVICIESGYGGIVALFVSVPIFWYVKKHIPIIAALFSMRHDKIVSEAQKPSL